MKKGFHQAVKGFARLSEDKMMNIVRESIQDMCELAQTPVARGGRMPVDTGNLRNSFVSGIGGSIGASGAESYVITIARLTPGVIARFGWTAKYARHVEYGTRHFAGRHFASDAVKKFPSFVKANAERYK